MINLLPLQEKILLQQEERFKLILIIGIIAFSLMASFALILLSMNIFISSSVDAQKLLVNDSEKDFNNSQLRAVREKIVQANNQLGKMDNFYKSQPDFTQILEKISGVFPSGIYLNAILANAQEKKSVIFHISGFAQNRGSLLQLKSNLEKDGGFTEIDFPPEDWIKPESIEFSATFKTNDH